MRTLTIRLAAVVMVALLSFSCVRLVKDRQLDLTVSEINDRLDGKNRPGYEKIFVSYDDNYVTCNYIVDEDVLSIAEMKDNSAVQKKLYADDISGTSSFRPFVRAIKDSGRGMKFDFKGNRSGDEYEIAFDNSAL